MTRITVFDPALADNAGNASSNLGDIIITRSVDRVLAELFSGADVARVSTHTPPTQALLEQALDADLNLIAGTNLLSSHVVRYNQWKLFDDPLHHANPPFLEAVLCGVGWWQYQDEPDAVTRWFYDRVLARTGPHSLRDAYSLGHLSRCGLGELYNTSCPTLWQLQGRQTAREGNAKVCLFTLTDYSRNAADEDLIRTLVRLYPEGIVFFPQGSHDLDYISSLSAFAECRNHIELLGHSPASLDDLAGRASWDYVGTRLHAGIWSLEQGHSSLILCVDNRAREIARETGLAVVERGDMTGIEHWHAGRHDGVGSIALPLDAIGRWKQRLHDFCERRVMRRRNDIGDVSAPSRAEGLRINFGWVGRAREGWVNVGIAQAQLGEIEFCLADPLPFADASAAVVCASHVLQRLERNGALRFLEECRRILRPSGVLRLAVPDLCWLVDGYRAAFDAARDAMSEGQATGGADVIARHEYAVINLVDQLCRHVPGGEMLRFWRRSPLPAAEYVMATNGVEAVRSLIALQLQDAAGEGGAGPAPGAHMSGASARPSFMQRLKYAFAPGKYPLPASAQPDAANARLGRFRTSGEPHLWMYDEVSLGLLLRQAGFADVTRRTATESAIPGFSSYALDTCNDGSTYKPESLFVEAVR
ncbi:methyltransferase domain-containing protein [Desulfovibrio oxamicus]|uniref:Methyltransferase domain-containing protein n=1 Tax=Nitratidesulfovibrio oxamicus TaxID=32016 RepID=A0ABS0J827_9BACT|nr:polysaccharide pyruvyl transferase family protein [Nitratidesulfovibrio oxamicus]MBG3878610.1 methyltransferase domain-containing protein [Nitratidesulfovibrio oxamicus]